MSLRRLASYRALPRTVKFTPGHLSRWQSTGSSGGSGGGLKKVIVGVGLTGAVAGGVLAYGNYNPVFKNQLDLKVPGFASWTDKAADVWVDLTDFFRPKPPGSKAKTEQDKLVYEYNKTKTKVNLPSKEEPKVTKKGDAEPKKSTSEPKLATAPKDKEFKSSSEPKVTVSAPKDEPKGAEPKDGEKKSSPESKAAPSSATKEPKVKEKPEVVATKKQEDVKEKKKEPDVVATKKQEDVKEEGAKEKAEVKRQEDVKEKKEPEVVATKKQEDAKEKAEVKKQESVKEEGSKPAAGDKSSPVEQLDPKSAIPSTPSAEKGGRAVESVYVDEAPQIDTILDDLYERFSADASRIQEAQQNLSRAWQNLYHKLTLSSTGKGEGSREKAIAEAKDVASKAQSELLAAEQSYNRSNQRLKELLRVAPEEGFMTKASNMESAVKVREAEVDLGRILVKEAVSSAAVVEKYREAVQQSRDKLQKELEAAAALVNPERKDSLLLSLNKKVELLDYKLKEVETEHAQKLMLALEVQKKNLEEVSENKLERVLNESEAKYESELAKEVDKISTHYSGMLREQLRLENEAHTKEMEEALEDQAEELNSEWSSEMNVKLYEQQGVYQVELAKAKARLRGLEMMMDGVTSAGEKVLYLQTMRSSCDALAGALSSMNTDSDTAGRYSLAAEFSALREAADGDPFVATVLDSVPPQAVGGAGIQSEAGLRERFVRVKRICKRVALVPETGGGLGTYVISWLQSMLTIHALLPREAPADANLADFHAYDLLQLAEARLRKGDLEGAVHYMYYLRGEPKNVAKDWLEDARLYLEASQAVQVLRAYVAANAAVFSAGKE